VTARLRALFEHGRKDQPLARAVPGGSLAIGAAVAVALFALGWRQGSIHPRPAVRAAPAAGLERGLLGYWRFDEAPGSVAARDLSGGRNDCVLRRLDPGTVWTPGKIGGALALDGHGWLECPQVQSLSALSNELTIAAWVTRGSALPRYHAVVARQKDAGRLDELMFGFIGSDLFFDSHVWKVKVTHPLPAGLAHWFHIAVSRHRDGTTVLFVDGKEIGRSTNAPADLEGGSNPLIIGAAKNDANPLRGQAHFDGALDELLIYDRALPAGEIAALAAGTQPHPPAGVAKISSGN
jgi:sialidase-1